MNPYIIAEAAQGYEGSVDIAKLLIKAAATAKADAIKFQVVYAEDLCEKDYQYYDLFKQLELSQPEWLNLVKFAHQNNIEFIADIFGSKSFNIIKNINVDGIKLHSSNFFDTELTTNTLSLNKKTYLSVGGIHYPEIELLIKTHNLVNKNITVLFGFQSEPTPIESNNLLRIQTLKDKTGLDIGFMDHSEAGGEYDISLSAFALGMGVRTFEKHITLDRELELEDYISALTPAEFAKYVTTIKNLPKALGESSLKLTDAELTYRDKALKKVVATRDINSGETITRNDVRLSRPKLSGGYYQLSEVLNQTAKTKLKLGNPINKQDLL